MARSSSDVIVVGAGVIGVCTAYYLARRGVAVTVIERDEVGQGASYGNAGCIAAGHGPMNKPGRIKQAVKSLADPLSPLYVAPRFDPSLVKWLWEFARHCTEEHVERAMRVLGPLGHRSIALFQELQADEQRDCDCRLDGYYDIFLTETALGAAEREAAIMQQQGYAVERVSGDELRYREPAVHDAVVGGVFYQEAGTVDPYRFVTELASRAARQGTRFVSGTEVVELTKSHGRVTGIRQADGDSVSADAVVLATGAYSKGLLRKLGLRLPLQPAKGYHRDCLPREGVTPNVRATCMLGEKSVFCTPMSGRVRFAGTLEFSGLNHDIRRPRLEQLTNAARLYLQGMGDAEATSEWCGLRPCLSDGLPAIGPVPSHDGLFVATGHAMLGLTLGPVTGELMARMVFGDPTEIDVGPLSPGRF